MSKESNDCELVFSKEKNTPVSLVASFRSGTPEFLSESGNGDTTDTESVNIPGLKVNLYEKAKKKSKRHVLALQTKRMIYTAQDYGDSSSSLNYNNYVVGVLDKTSSKMKLVDIPHIYALQQSIRGYRSNIDKSTEGEDTSYAAKRKALVDAFGNKISKRISKSYEENRVDADNVSGAAAITKALDAKVQDAKVTKAVSGVHMSSEAAALHETRMQQLPPFNADAKKPDKVYDPKKFLKPEELEALNLKAQEFISVIQETSVQNYLLTRRINGGYVADGLLAIGNTAASSLSSKKTLVRIGYLLYTRYLLKLYCMHYPIRKSPEKVAEDLDIPFVIVENALALFADASQKGPKTVYMLPKQFKDKLMLYILSLALVTSDCVLDVDSICVDLKKTAQFVGRYCAQLGCKVNKVKASSSSSSAGKTASQSLQAVLQVPLTFPAPKKGGQKRN